MNTGAGVGDVFVSYACQGESAKAEKDFLPCSGVLAWNASELTPKVVEVTLLESELPEGLEAFRVVLHDAAPGSSVSSTHGVCFVTIAEHDDASDALTVVVHVAADAADLQLDTPSGAAFAANFTTYVSALLAVQQDRLSVFSVHASPIGAVVAFHIAAAGGAAPANAPTADDAASTFVELARDPSSPLMNNTAFPAIVLQTGVEVFGRGTGDDGRRAGSGGLSPAAVAAVVVAVVAVVALVTVGYAKRVAVTEWLLWRLGNFRFRALHERRAAHMDTGPDDSQL